MIREYLDAAMRRAEYKTLPEDGSYYGEIPGFEGVQASAKTLAECRNTLEEVLEKWALLRVYRGIDVPVLDGMDLKFGEAIEDEDIED